MQQHTEVKVINKTYLGHNMLKAAIQDIYLYSNTSVAWRRELITCFSIGFRIILLSFENDPRKCDLKHSASSWAIGFHCFESFSFRIKHSEIERPIRWLSFSLIDCLNCALVFSGIYSCSNKQSSKKSESSFFEVIN